MLAGDLAGSVSATVDESDAPPRGAGARFQMALLEALSEASPDGILVVAPDGGILTYNRRFAEMWNLGDPVLALRSDAAALDAVRSMVLDPDEFLAKVEHLYAHPGETSRDELQLRDGRVFDRYSTPVVGADGTGYGRVWFFRDVTAERQAEAARVQLERERAMRDSALQRVARLRGLHEAALALAGPVAAEPRGMADLLATIVRLAVTSLAGRDGRLVLAEDAAWAGLVQGDDGVGGSIVLDHAGRLRRAAQRPDGATEHVLATGELVEVPDTRDASRFGPYPQLAAVGIGSLVMAPLRSGGEVRGVLGVTFNEQRVLDTEEREALDLFAAHAAAALERVRLANADQQLARQNLELARREVEAASLRELDRLKNELLSTVSHELRTPLAIIHGYAQFIARREGEMSAQAQRIVTASAHLNRLVEDLVDFAQLTRGTVAVRPERVDLAPLLGELAAEFRERTGGQRLTAQLPETLPAHADRARVGQIVLNLLENAVKYAPEGEIVLRAFWKRARGRGEPVGPTAAPAPAPAMAKAGRGVAAGYVRVEVVDSGPGVPAAERHRVWERFYRGQNVSTLNLAGGTGIGLAVVKALAEAQGGRVGLSSGAGRGARFWFELPAA